MKNVMYLICLSLLLATTNGISQTERGPQCTTCTDPNDYITNNGDNTFTADSALAYYWEICSGGSSVSIIYGNTEQYVTVQGTPGSSFSIKVTRFVNGNCIEACETGTIQAPNCDDCVTVTVIGNQSGVDCEDAYAQILPSCTNFSNITSVDWSYGLAGSCNSQSFCNLSPASTNSSNWFKSPVVPLSTYCYDDPYTSPIIVFEATIHYTNGDCISYGSELLVCANANEESCSGGGSPGLNNEPSIYPNPSIGNNDIFFKNIEVENIVSINILDITGNTKKTIYPTKNQFSISGLQPGLYIVEFKDKKQSIFQRKLIIR